MTLQKDFCHTWKQIESYRNARKKNRTLPSAGKKHSGVPNAKKNIKVYPMLEKHRGVPSAGKRGVPNARKTETCTQC